MNQRASLTLSRTAFKSNVDNINALSGYQSLALVVKSNAYGHGIFQIASLADLHPGVSWICTAGIDEAIYLRNKGILKPILVLSFMLIFS